MRSIGAGESAGCCSIALACLQLWETVLVLLTARLTRFSQFTTCEDRNRFSNIWRLHEPLIDGVARGAMRSTLMEWLPIGGNSPCPISWKVKQITEQDQAWNGTHFEHSEL